MYIGNWVKVAPNQNALWDMCTMVSQNALSFAGVPGSYGKLWNIKDMYKMFELDARIEEKWWQWWFHEKKKEKKKRKRW